MRNRFYLMIELDDREVRRIEFSITSEDGNPYTQLYTLAGDGTAYD